MALSAQLRLTRLPLDRELFACFEEPPVPLTRLLCCNGPHRGLYSKHQRGKYRRPLGGSKHLGVFNKACAPSLRLPAGSPALPTGHRRKYYPTG